MILWRAKPYVRRRNDLWHRTFIIWPRWAHLDGPDFKPPVLVACQRVWRQDIAAGNSGHIWRYSVNNPGGTP